MVTTNNSTDNNQSNGEENLIYSAQAPQQYDDNELEYENNSDTIPQVLDLNLRGVHIQIDRDTLLSLPESLLIVMFPQGLVLGGSNYENEDEDYPQNEDLSKSDQAIKTTLVDFDAACLKHVLRFYRQVQEQQDQDTVESIFASAPAAQFYPSLLSKHPVIVLREELEYYCVYSGKRQMQQIKIASGDYLKHNDQIFSALQKNIARENNTAEQHLIDMLCDTGFSRDDRWGYREIEPNRTCIASMSLVPLKSPGNDRPSPTAQKLLLFWRKPARKCWWDGNTVEIAGEKIRLWARRTWTLELALI